MQMRNHESKNQLNPRRERLDLANAEEIRLVRLEVGRIKRAHIKKFGLPKHETTLPFDDIASHKIN
ncbi:MAG: hypothetical protein QG549_820 [Patescibacteria group bacterium]|nr:hypothetical protein [Patescibacteria group bacterium]